MPQPTAEYMTEVQFFDFVHDTDGKWELVDGVPVMTACPNQRHQAIVASTFASLFSQLRGKPFRPTAADTGVSTGVGTVRYPNVVVDCGRRDDQSMVATEPTLVIEVLSPSTRSFDSHRKVLEYKSNPDVTHILIIDTDNACCLLHYREGEGWEEAMYDSLDAAIDLPGIGATLVLSDIYDGLEFKPSLVRQPVCPTCGETPCVCDKNESSMKR